MGWWWYETKVCSAAVEERAAFYARPESPVRSPGAYCRRRAVAIHDQEGNKDCLIRTCVTRLDFATANSGKANQLGLDHHHVTSVVCKYP